MSEAEYLTVSRRSRDRRPLPVLQKLEGTDGWVLWIFIISSIPTFSRSRNLFRVVPQSYHVRVTSKIQVNFRSRGYSRVLSIGSCGFQ